MCFKMDLFDTDLSKVVDRGPMSLGAIRHVLRSVISAVGYLHERGFMHRDVKPGNLVVKTTGEVALADFSLTRELPNDNTDLTKIAGTRWYKPPELFLGARTHGKEIDVWACGCLFAECLLGTPVFPGTSDLDMLSRIFELRGSPTRENFPEAFNLPYFFEFEPQEPKILEKVFPSASQEALELLERMLSLSPSKRPSAEEILASSFFAQDKTREDEDRALFVEEAKTALSKKENHSER